MPDPDSEDGRVARGSTFVSGDESPGSNGGLSESSHPRISRMARVEISATEFTARWQKRFDATWVGKVWGHLSALDFVDSSLQFSAAFILFFVPFLLLISAVIGRNLPAPLSPEADSVRVPLATSHHFSPTVGHPSPPSRSSECS
jgi:hypothetical protein